MGTETRARIAFAAVLGATLLSFKLVFDNGDYAGPAILGCVLAMGISALARRWGAGPILTLEVSLAALFWYLTLLFEAGRSFYGIPTPAAATGLSRLVSSAVDASVIDFAPVPVRAGYVIMIVAGFWLATTIGEISTFRWRRPLLASIPAIALFTVAMTVGTGAAPAAYLTPFLIALFTFWASEASLRMRSWGRWIGPWEDKNDEPELVTGTLARRMGASCLAVTLAAPIFLPTLGDGWLPWRNDGGDGRGGAGGESGEINLLVDLAPQLLEQSDTRLFTVNATATTATETVDGSIGSYWRLASLARFDGRLWHPLDTDRLPMTEDGVDRPPTVETTLVQEVVIENLESDYLPAAVQPVTLTDSDVSAEYDLESFDLRAITDLGEGDGYTVTSALAAPTYEQLRSARIDEPPSDEYLDVGGQLDQDVTALLDAWTADESTPFEKLLAIQEQLRSPVYIYDESVKQNPDSDDYLRDFLITNQRGFCQQFATAFALLARELGYPTRISVGFLPGEKDEDGNFVVRGTDAHAWPEVKFEDYGWVRFEPTTRAITNPPSYTLGTEFTAGLNETRTGAEPDSPNTAPSRPNIGPRGDRLPDFESNPIPPEERIVPVPEPAWENAFFRLVMALLVIGVAWALGVPALKRERTKRRYRRARTPADGAIAAFMQFEDEAGEMFSARRPAESARAYAHRLGTENHVPALPAERLAELYEAAAYSPSGISEQQALEARKTARKLAASLWARANLWQKANRILSVRSLVSGIDLKLRRPRAHPA